MGTKKTIVRRQKTEVVKAKGVIIQQAVQIREVDRKQPALKGVGGNAALESKESSNTVEARRRDQSMLGGLEHKVGGRKKSNAAALQSVSADNGGSMEVATAYIISYVVDTNCFLNDLDFYKLNQIAERWAYISYSRVRLVVPQPREESA